MGILYLITAIILLVAFLLVKKSDEKQNIVSWVILSMISYLGYNIGVCFVFGNIGIHTSLLFLSIINLLVSAGCGFLVYKTKEKQQYYFRKRDLLGVVLCLAITIYMGAQQYHPFDGTIATASVDGSMHFSAAKNFADHMIILSKIDNQTGYNFLTMQPGAYVNTGILMSIVRSVYSGARDFITFKCFEIGILALNLLAFYMLIADKLSSKYKVGIGLIFLCLYAFAYPYTSLLYGFSYLSLAIAFCVGMFHMAKLNAKHEIKFAYELVLIILMGIGIIFSYCLFVPAMFAFICINSFLFDTDKEHKLFKKSTVIITACLLVVTVVAILYLVIPTFTVKTQNKLTDAIGFDGQIYRGFYIDFLFYVPFAILFIYKAMKDRKWNPILIALILLGAHLGITLGGLLMGKVSSYYYYKIYSVIYPILVYIAVEIMCESTSNKEIQVFLVSYLALFIGIILCAISGLELRLYQKYPGLGNAEKSSAFAGIYFDTNIMIVRNINVSCIVDENRVKLGEAMGQVKGMTLKNMLVGGMNTNCKAWLYVISGIGCGGESINDLQVAVVETSVEDWLANDEKEFFVLFTGDKFDDTDKYEVEFQNEAGVILKRK